MTSPPAKTPVAGPGRGHKAEDKTKYHRDTSFSQTAGGLKEKRLRAILRAPEPIQAAYRDGLIGQVDAARLGPKVPTEAQASAST